MIFVFATTAVLSIRLFFGIKEKVRNDSFKFFENQEKDEKNQEIAEKFSREFFSFIP